MMDLTFLQDSGDGGDPLVERIVTQLYQSALAPGQWQASLHRAIVDALAQEAPWSNAAERIAALCIERAAHPRPEAVLAPWRDGPGMRMGDAPDAARDPRVRSLADRLAPHVRNCVRIRSELNRMELRVIHLEGTLDALAFGLLILGPGERIVHANRRATEILQEFPLIAIRDGRLVGTHGDTQRKLTGVLSVLAARDAGPDVLQSAAMRIVNGTAAEPLRVVAVPLNLNVRDHGSADGLVFLFAGRIGAAEKEDFLRRVFGLTPMEARCALRLAAGDSLDKAAAHAGIATNTMRTHLRSLFVKTGVHRQGALVARLSREIAVLELA